MPIPFDTFSDVRISEHKSYTIRKLKKEHVMLRYPQQQHVLAFLILLYMLRIVILETHDEFQE